MNIDKLKNIQGKIEEIFEKIYFFKNYGDDTVTWNNSGRCWEYEGYSHYVNINYSYVKLYVGERRCTVKEVQALYSELKKILEELESKIQKDIYSLDV